MIELKALTKSYDGKTRAVDNLDLTIENGEIFGILGPNGAGKTTTLKMLTGILEPTAGEVKINSFDIQKQPIQAKQQFAYVPDDPNLFLQMKGLEYLMFIANIYDVDPAERTKRIERLAADFGLTDRLGNKIQTYSHGMRQKIVLIGALLHNPPVWILDEPMTGLDPKAAFLLKQKMREHADCGNLVVFSTHVLDVAEKVCDRLAIIDKGQIIFCGTIAEMRRHFASDESLEEMFLELTQADPGGPNTQDAE